MAVEAVFDTSVLIAFLKREPEWATIERWLGRSGAISALTMQELVSKAVDGGMATDEAAALPADLGLLVHPLTEQLAIEAGAMIAVTRSRGLSHGDRACLALSRALGLPAVTADRAWAEVAGPLGVTVELVR